MKLIFSLVAACALIYLPLFLYTQIAVMLERIRTFGYTWEDHQKIVEGLPVFRLRIPFWPEIKQLFRVSPILVIMVSTLILGLIAFLVASRFMKGRHKTEYERKSYSRLLNRWQRKRGLCRIEYTATKHFNVYGGKGLVTRHTPRVLLETILKPLYIVHNRIAEEYNWPRRKWWNLQKGRALNENEARIEGFDVNRRL